MLIGESPSTTRPRGTRRRDLAAQRAERLGQIEIGQREETLAAQAREDQKRQPRAAIRSTVRWQAWPSPP